MWTVGFTAFFQFIPNVFSEVGVRVLPLMPLSFCLERQLYAYNFLYGCCGQSTNFQPMVEQQSLSCWPKQKRFLHIRMRITDLCFYIYFFLWICIKIIHNNPFSSFPSFSLSCTIRAFIQLYEWNCCFNQSNFKFVTLGPSSRHTVTSDFLLSVDWMVRALANRIWK